MSPRLLYFLVIMAVAVVWGWFSDLRHGDTGWFIVRLALSAVAALLLPSTRWFQKRHGPQRADTEAR